MGSHSSSIEFDDDVLFIEDDWIDQGGKYIFLHLSDGKKKKKRQLHSSCQRSGAETWMTMVRICGLLESPH